MANKIKILWADDEIDMLKPQLYFLEKKGYQVMTVTNGQDAIDEFKSESDFDVVFLDESMPGLTGLDTLIELKKIKEDTPIVMITKNEAENIMEEAIGNQISDYLIKPVNPNQILLTLKKIIDNKRIVSEKTMMDYQMDFRNIFMEINSNLDHEGWTSVYRKLIDWELKIEQSETGEMIEMLDNQKQEANASFSKFVLKNYINWFGNDKSNAPIFSHDLIKKLVFPKMNKDKPSFFLLLDNLRLDQWKIIQPEIAKLFKVEKEEYFYSMLPTCTQYSRNAIFAGLTPYEIEKHYKQYWLHDFEEGGKNNFEGELLQKQFDRLVKGTTRVNYIKITNLEAGKRLQEQILDNIQYDFTAIVYNFIDMLSHARTEMEVLKELAYDDKAYRSLTLSWFKNSPIWEALVKLADKDIQLFITTDHGTIRVQNPTKVVGDKDTTTNLRYKMGRKLQYDAKDVLDISEPEKVGLPRPNISSRYLFAMEDKYFVYPNNSTYYTSFFRNTFQHGGVSMHEMICPMITLKSKS